MKDFYAFATSITDEIEPYDEDCQVRLYRAEEVDVQLAARDAEIAELRHDISDAINSIKCGFYKSARMMLDAAIARQGEKV